MLQRRKSPALTFAGRHIPHFWRTPEGAVADSGIAENMRRSKLTTGPNMAVIGAITSPRSGDSVFWARFTPAGSSIALVKNGFDPVAIACGTQARYHTLWTGSAPGPARRLLDHGSIGQ